MQIKKKDSTLITRLTSISGLKNIPREELQWLVDNGTFEIWEVGEIVGAKGEAIEFLWIIFKGKIAIRVDRGVGARLVTEWIKGDVTGMLPYSRMKSPPGDNYIKERAEMLSISVKLFPEMITHCQAFTAYCVHSMIDRVRSFNTSDLQDEKMASLGKLAAGLAHELNNPASATVRDSKLLLENLHSLNSASIALSTAGLNKSQLDAIKDICKKCLDRSRDRSLSPIERADYQDSINTWLQSHKINEDYVDGLSDTMATVDELDKLAASVSDDSLQIALKWIVTSYSVNELAMDMERSARQIHKLVDSVKKFTYLDDFADKASIDVELGIRDTISVLTSKFRAKKTYVNLEIENGLPHVYANGNELNQIWLILMDNALDAIAQGGRIDIIACADMHRVDVKIIDNGPGIVPEIISRIFDPFFTTKPPGQGTGLGLDIARRLIRRYGGDISVQSRPGKTEFTVSLLTENK